MNKKSVNPLNTSNMNSLEATRSGTLLPSSGLSVLPVNGLGAGKIFQDYKHWREKIQTTKVTLKDTSALLTIRNEEGLNY